MVKCVISIIAHHKMIVVVQLDDFVHLLWRIHAIITIGIPRRTTRHSRLAASHKGCYP